MELDFTKIDNSYVADFGIELVSVNIILILYGKLLTCDFVGVIIREDELKITNSFAVYRFADILTLSLGSGSDVCGNFNSNLVPASI